ncbi:MAG: alpha/beta fold hydrolase [Arenimonas sp.]
MMIGHVVVSHGFDANPQGTKALACAAAARALGWTEERPDYRPFDTRLDKSSLGDVEARIDHLRAIAQRCARPLVLAGSSLGAFICARVSLDVPVAGLFLMAPPVWLHEYDFALQAAKVPTWVVHGWNDEIITAMSVAAWAQARDIRTTFVPDTHRLEGHVDYCGQQFGQFLQALQ